MMKLARERSWLGWGLLACALAGCGSGDADVAPRVPSAAVSVNVTSSSQSLARPLVPSDYEETAFGFIHPSCVIQLAADDRELEDGSILHADGTLRTVTPCAYPRYDAQGNEIPVVQPPVHCQPQDPDSDDPAPDCQAAEYPGANGPEAGSGAPEDPASDGEAGSIAPETPDATYRATDNDNDNDDSTSSFSGYLAYVYDASHGPLVYLSATYQVPKQPTAREGQRLSYWPGLEVVGKANTSVLQPVLRWYAAEGGWVMLAEHCCRSGNETQGPHVRVNPGDTIVGTLAGLSCDTNGNCPSWMVYAMDQNTKQTTVLNTPSFGQAFDAAMISLEGFDFTKCSQHSASGSVTFSNISALQAKGGAVSTFRWHRGNTSNAGSPCHERATPSADTRTVRITTDTR